MLRDETVFIMGEEVARYNGAYKVGLGDLDRALQAMEMAFLSLNVGRNRSLMPLRVDHERST